MVSVALKEDTSFYKLLFVLKPMAKDSSSQFKPMAKYFSFQFNLLIFTPLLLKPEAVPQIFRCTKFHMKDHQFLS